MAKKWEKWEKTRSKGTLHYVITQGVMYLIVFLVLGFLFDFLRALYNSDLESFFVLQNYYVKYLTNERITAGIIGASVSGFITWGIFETDYQKSRNNENFNFWIPRQDKNLK